MNTRAVPRLESLRGFVALAGVTARTPARAVEVRAAVAARASGSRLRVTIRDPNLFRVIL
jgi:hypothetical protein